MATTDSYGQNISIAGLTDKPNAQTLAEGLAALVPKSVMTFASAALRGATITAPVGGMVSWLNDTKRLEVYDGTSWVTVATGTTRWTTVPLTSGWGHNGNSNGDFQYRVVNWSGEPTIVFRGAISRTAAYPATMPTYFTLNSNALPVGARPSVLRTISVPCSDVSSDRISLKMDVRPDGDLRLYGLTSGVTKPPWVGFNGTFCSL